MSKKIDYYTTKNNKAPFLEWRDKLDVKTKVVVDRFIQRVSQGGAKKSIKNLNDNIFEIKIPYGPGLRVDFGEDGGRIILLLIGGQKGSQNRDIKKAKNYWSDYGKQK